MVNPLIAINNEAQLYTEQTKNEIQNFAPSQKTHALQGLANKIIPLFEKSQAASKDMVPGPIIGINEQEYAQRSVLEHPCLFPYFNQLFPDICDSLENTIERYLKVNGKYLRSWELPDAFESLSKALPQTEQAMKVLVEMIDKIYNNQDRVTKSTIYNILANEFDPHDQLTDFLCVSKYDNPLLLLKVAYRNLIKESFNISKILVLISVLAQSIFQTSLPDWIKLQLLEIKDHSSQSLVIKRLLNFIFLSQKNGVLADEFLSTLENPMIWMCTDEAIGSLSERLMNEIFENKENKHCAVKAFKTFRENYPLSHIVALSEGEKVSLLLSSLAAAMGFSEVCDFIHKQGREFSKNDETKISHTQLPKSTKLYSSVLLSILRADELEIADKEYLLKMIFREENILNCLFTVQAILEENGIGTLKKANLEKNCLKGIFQEVCPYSQFAEGKIDPEVAKMTAEILSTEGFKKEESRDLGHEPRNEQTIAEVQGTTAFCNKTLQFAIETPSVLSSRYLRGQQNVNRSLSLALRYKWFGHNFNLMGMVPLPDGTQVDLEGFNETFVLPMLRALFEEFAAVRKDLINDKLKDFVLESLKRAMWHENASDEKIEEIHKLIHDFTNLYPVIVGSGWDWHSTQVVFYCGYVFYINRGANCGVYPGIAFFKIGNIEKITPEFLKGIVNRLTVSKFTYTEFKKIAGVLEGSGIDHINMKEQKVGNCVISSLRGVFRLLLRLGTSEEVGKPIYKAFSQFVKEDALRDFLIDLENPNTENMSEEEGKNYMKGLNAVGEKFETWANAHQGPKKKVSADLMVRALTILCK